MSVAFNQPVYVVGDAATGAWAFAKAVGPATVEEINRGFGYVLPRGGNQSGPDRKDATREAIALSLTHNPRPRRTACFAPAKLAHLTRLAESRQVSLEARFWPKVRKIYAGRRGAAAKFGHRVAWELTYGPIPPGCASATVATILRAFGRSICSWGPPPPIASTAVAGC